MITRQHNGFLGIDSAIMIGFMFLGVASLMLMYAGIIAMIVPDLHTTITEMPTIYDYNEEGLRVDSEETPEQIESRSVFNGQLDSLAEDIEDEIAQLKDQRYDAIISDDNETKDQLTAQIEELEIQLMDLGYVSEPNINLRLYWMFGNFSLTILGGILIISVVMLALERVNFIVKRGTSKKTFQAAVVGIIIIFVVPEIWDPIAIMDQTIALYMLDPINGEPHETTQKLWCRMGAMCTPEDSRLLDSDVHKMLLADPLNFGQEIFASTFLAFFKLTATSMISLLFFITSIIRVTFILIILITLPLWVIFGFISRLKQLTQAVIASFIGSCIAPIFVSTILFVGEQYISSKGTPAFEEWITVLGIAILAQTFLVILAPILGSTISQANSITQTAIQSTAMAASQFGSAGGRAGGSSYMGSRNTGSGIGNSVGSGTGYVPGGNFSFGGFGSSSFSNKENPLSRGMAFLNAGKQSIYAGSIAATQALTRTRIPTMSSNMNSNDNTDDQQRMDDVYDDDQK